MSYNTKVVVFCGTSDREGVDRVEKALHAFADGTNGRACAFERIVEDWIHYGTSGHGTTFIGCGNYLVEEPLLDALRTAADTRWGHFDPLTVILRGDDEDLRQRVRLLDDEGNWTRV